MPSSRWRRIHLYAVARLIPSCSPTCAAGQPASTRAIRSWRPKTQTRPRMCHESLPLGLVLNTPNPAAGLSSVNNVCGDYN